MAQGRRGDRDGEAAPPDSPRGEVVDADARLFDEQMRSLGVRPAHAVRGGRGRPRAGRGKRRPAATDPPGASQADSSLDGEDSVFLQAMAQLETGPTRAPAPAIPAHTSGPRGAAAGPPPDEVSLRAEDALFVEAMTGDTSGGPDAAFAPAEGPEHAAPRPQARPRGRGRARRFIGTPKALRRRIRQGEIQPDAELDLHGLRREEARQAVARLVRAAVGDGHEVLRVICGRGLHSAEGPVLRDAVRQWLRRDHGDVVVEVVSAPPAYGGDGVWYAFLRRFA